MIKFRLALFAILLSTQTTLAQKYNAIYIEGGGTGILGTLNYERIKLGIKNNSESGNAIRFGFGLSPKYINVADSNNRVNNADRVALIFVAGYNHFFNFSHTGQNPNFCELGLNLVVATKNSILDEIWKQKDKTRIFPSVNIGMRHQPVNGKGILWRINYIPFYINSGLKHWLGASIGYSF